jgi:hypothetical protein
MVTAVAVTAVGGENFFFDSTRIVNGQPPSVSQPPAAPPALSTIRLRDWRTFCFREQSEFHHHSAATLWNE